MQSFLSYVRSLWLSRLPVQLIKAILVGVLFELFIYLINRRLQRALAPALARDADAEPALRMQRRRIVLGLPQLLVHAVLLAVALLIILRIFGYRNEVDLYPVAFAIVIVAAVAGRNALRDMVAGYLIQYDYLYAVGDEIDVGEYSGVVSEISLRHTILRTRDRQQIVIRNSEIRQMVNRTGLRRGEDQRQAGRESQRVQE